MSVRSHHFRRCHRATRTAEPVLGEFRAAEVLEDRTLLSGVTAIDGQDSLLVEEIGLTEDVHDDVFASWEQFIVSVVEAQLAVAETADLEPSVEPRAHFGDVRLAAHALVSLHDVLHEQQVDGADMWLEVLSLESLNDDFMYSPQTDSLVEDEVPQDDSDLIGDDSAFLSEFQLIVEVSDQDGAVSELLLVTVGVYRLNESWNPVISDDSGEGGFKSEETFPGFNVTMPLEPSVDAGGASNRVSNSFIPGGFGTDVNAVNTSEIEAGLPLTGRDETTATASRQAVSIASVATTTADVFVPMESVVPEALGEKSDSLPASVFGEEESPTSTVAVIEAGLETWRVEDIGFGVSASLVAGAAASMETQMLLDGIRPVEISGVVTEPLQPVLGLAGSVILMLQTVGRTALLAVFGEGGAGPIAEFVEPIIDLAEIGNPPKRWELKIVDSVVPGPIVQAVSSDRHFEIRNIGPAANVEGALPDVATLTLLTLPRHGVLEHVGATQNMFRYVPDPGFSGVDEFRYRLKTASGESHEGQLVIHVPATSSPAGLRTATRNIELRLDVDRNVAATNNVFEDFEDWRGGLD